MRQNAKNQFIIFVDKKIREKTSVCYIDKNENIYCYQPKSSFFS
jgi:hypothetical protein